MATRDIRVPDIGDFRDVEVVEVLVSVGDGVAAEQGLITLETDKATMEVPAPFAGRVVALAVEVGSRVSEGDVIARVETPDEAPDEAPARQPAEPAADPAVRQAVATSGSAGDGVPEAAAGPVGAARAAGQDADEWRGPVDHETGLLVLGAGPGGYTAAFRAADLGMDVTLVERWPTLGGVCLNVGCIPSKALLHAAKVIEEAAAMEAHGIAFGKPRIDAGRLREWKDQVVARLTGGLSQLAKQRKVRVVHGTGRFLSPHHVVVEGDGGRQVIAFRQCIIAAGSEPVRIPGFPDDPRIIDSTGALELDLPHSLLVIGGGIIGLEMACVYDALGVEVTVVELMDQLMPGCDRDLLRPLEKRIGKRYAGVLTGTRVSALEAGADGIHARFEDKDGQRSATFDRVLVAVGRTPNGQRIDAGKAGVVVDARGFIAVDRQMRTNVPHIHAIGDIVGQPMLAHKATHEGKVAAEVVAGHKRAFDARVIPAVAYTDPEIAWVGVTEHEAKQQGLDFGKGVFPWAASGRALALGRDEGMTKLLFDGKTRRIIGAGIVGPNAGELIAELALAIEMGCDAADIGLTIHPHPTLSETAAFAAEAFEGTLTDLYLPRRSRRDAPEH